MHFIQQHEFWSGVVGYWILSAAVSSLPAPMPNGSQGYLWMYNFSHTIVGNLTTAFGSKIPGLNKIAPLILMAFLVVPVSACHNYKIHPGAVNSFDSEYYDTLLIAQAVIQAGHDAYIKGQLSPTGINLLVSLEKAYNSARAVYLTWHDMSVAGNSQASSIQPVLQADLQSVTDAISAFNGSK